VSVPSDKFEVTFSKGLNQKADSRLVQEPELVRAVDVEFDDIGGLRLRKPYSALATDLLAGGMMSACRRIYEYGDELLVFTSDSLLSWSPQRAGWVNRGTHLAVKVEEEPKFVTTGDQVQCDRAELSNCVVHAWVDLAAGSTATGTVYYAITDKTTGAVTVAPTAIGTAGACNRPRLVATTTKILLFQVETTTPTLVVRAITPSDGSITSATTVMAANFGTYYDVVKTTGADSATFVSTRNPTTSYEVGTVTGALVVSQSTKARTCDGAITVSSDVDAKIQVIRGNGVNMQGDYLTAAFVDTTINQAIGTITAGTVAKITCAHRTDTRCYVFWNDGDTCKYNYVNTAGTIGTEGVFRYELDLASRAFAYGGNVYVVLQFTGTSFFGGGASWDGLAAQLQNTYYLFRDDVHLAAKMVVGRGDGDRPALLDHLPGVALTSGSTAFSWCATERRAVGIGTVSGGLGYGDRGPRDITITFDSNEARRVARLGKTLYISGGEVLQYDGYQITEVGFHNSPWTASGTESAAGSIAANGEYAFRFSYRWDNAKGERDRSTTGIAGSVTLAAAPGGVDIASLPPLHLSHKTNRPLAVEVWRTAINPTDEAPFYLVTNNDPTDTGGANCYIANDTTVTALATFNDAFADTTLTTKETNPENFGVLENIPPPPATLIVANDTRLFLAGIAGDPHRVWYSKQRIDGQVAAFHDALVAAIPEAGGDITGLAFLNETLVVFRETAIYALDGQGYDNTGGGQNYQARLVSSDCGAVNHESIVLTPMGLVFKSSRGWYLLNRGWATSYIGAGVCDYDTDTVYSAHLVEAQHQVRIITSARALVYDYLVEQWAEWSISDGLHATNWAGTYHYLATSSVKAEQSSFSAASYALDVEMLIHLNGIQGFSRLRRIMILGEYRSTHTLRVRIGEYAEDTYFDDTTWTVSPTTVGGELQVQQGPSRQQLKAVRIRITSSTTAGEKLKLSAISLEVAVKPGLFRHLPAAQRQ